MANALKTFVNKFAKKPTSFRDYSLADIGRYQGIVELSLDRRVITANEVFLNMLGYSQNEITNMDYGILVNPEFRDSANYHKLWQQLNSGEFVSDDFLYQNRDGKEVWGRASFNPIRDEDGKVSKVMGLVTDITDTKKEQLDEVEDLRVRASIIDTTSIVSDANLKGDILTINQKYIEVSKYSRDELIGQPHSITRHPDMPKEVFKEMWATIGRGKIFRGIIKNRAKDGTPYYVDAVVAPVLDKRGKPKKYIGVRYDITEAEIERHNMKGIFDAINAYYAYIEFDTQGKVLTANKNFLDLMEYQLDDVVGKHHRTFVDPSYANSSEYTRFWDDLAAGQSKTDTFHRVTRSGKGVYIQATYSPVKDEMGRVFKVAKIATDVTREKLEVVGQLDAISKAQAAIEFSMDGKITSVNDNFLEMFGYASNEVVGQHHSLLLDAGGKSSSEFKEFWERLNRGEQNNGQYKYIRRNGNEVWIQGFASPLVDLNKKPFKVVMYATDITQQVATKQMLESAVMQTKDVISAAREGDLSQRIPLDGKEGGIADLCDNVNSLIETTDVTMKEVGRVLEALAQGDLREKAPTDYQGAFGRLADHVNSTVDNLVNIVNSISESADVITDAIKEIASGNSDLSERTEKQAANLEETAASIEELTSTVRQNADNAQQANQLAIGASDVAEKGGNVVSQVVKTMSSINDSSKKIVDIISVIDGIAFQTNILALNAAVEAARAGEQGRGFAVVATEVRNLAQRSSAAAKEIKTLIGDSVEKVESGTKLVDEAGTTMDEIVQSIKHVADIIGEITTASHEQSSGIEQVNDAITQIDEGTQQNAALVEEAAATAEEMQTQAQHLTQAVGAFSLHASQEGSAKSHQAERRNYATRPFAGKKAPGKDVETAKANTSEEKKAPAIRSKVANAKNDDWDEF
ncbi:PAS domain-containing protein [Nitrosomonas sp.]|uniref:PAS domain-containing protein n=1 Tax=Nitrosomonas sp. TaxID=42353 RepID=UPI002852C9B5|nr:PAS domain-containing protein [Nitrosomonas sp.]